MKMTKNFAVLATIALIFLAQAVTAEASTTLSVNPATTNVNEGGSFSVDIDISTDDSVFSTSFYLNFDNTALVATGVTEGNFLKSDTHETYPIMIVDNDTGQIRYYSTRLGNVGGVTGTGTLLTIYFDTSGTNDSTLDLNSVEVYNPSVQLITSSATDGTVNVNGAPVLNAIGSKNVDENVQLQFTISATDPDTGDTLTYGAQNLPAGADFTGATFTWTPAYDQSGVYNVNFTVTDGNLIDYEIVEITINNINRAPQIDSFSPLTLTFSLFEGQDSQLFDHTSSDPDLDTLAYSWKIGGIEQATTSSWTFSPTDAVCGLSTITLNITDGEFSDAQSWTVDVILRGDVDKDLDVDIFDLEDISDTLHGTWNEDADIATCAPGIPAVGGSDGSVSICDLAFAGKNYGRSC